MSKGSTLLYNQRRAFLQVGNMTRIVSYFLVSLAIVGPYIKIDVLLALLVPLTVIRICSGFRSSRGRPARLTFSRLHFRNLSEERALQSAAVEILSVRKQGSQQVVTMWTIIERESSC